MSNDGVLFLGLGSFKTWVKTVSAVKQKLDCRTCHFRKISTANVKSILTEAGAEWVRHVTSRKPSIYRLIIKGTKVP